MEGGGHGDRVMKYFKQEFVYLNGIHSCGSVAFPLS